MSNGSGPRSSMDPERRRVAALVIRDGRVLMVRERNRSASGRHDGDEMWTLPGGGIEPGESLEDAVRREVREEVGLEVTGIEHRFDFAYPSGWTACFEVAVEPGEPTLGIDHDKGCDCPRMVGLEWMPLGARSMGDTGVPVPVLYMAVPTSDPSA